jgi:hypothetical protein
MTDADADQARPAGITAVQQIANGLFSANASLENT